MSFCVQIWKMCSAIWCKCGFLLPFSMIVVALKLSVRTSTASCWSWLENDCRHVLIASSSLLVELVSCSWCVNRPWLMMFPSLLKMYPPYECSLASVNMICVVGWCGFMAYPLCVLRLLFQNWSSSLHWLPILKKLSQCLS